MGDTQAPLLRDLITIPERVHQGDFVLKLSEGVSDAHAEETVKNYVVTDQLRNRSTTPWGSFSAPRRSARAPPATCTVRSAPAKAISWRC